MYRFRNASVSSFTILLGLLADGRAGELKLPVACDVGRTCFIQNYVDVDPGSAATDYMCGTLTYDGHNGIDFRLPSRVAQQAHVHVLAAADGEVIRTRDGIDDVAIKPEGRGKVSGHECGNGVVIKHPQDLETQYCHMAKGSIAVKSRDKVTAGQVLGDVGMSGLTEYPHLHFVVRRGGKVIDPFADGRTPGACNGNAESQWHESVRAQLAYSPRTILNFGFTTGSVTTESVETGVALQHQPTMDSEAIVAFVRTIGLKAGDVQTLTLRDPAGKVLAENRPVALDRNKAQFVLFSGKKRAKRDWDRGFYTATYVVKQEDQSLLEKQFQLELR
ncbi:M23 family metallopeptidase [Bradyrhizobium sp. AUGA SZCCT0240]|uniref:M23 family metallopeptidase n=2 Tax=Bradyrhizobium TaxID=374 RepID=UPI001BA9D702|nr:MULTISPECIES: M23 family metallopeptidase [unclassified Bradyrhizobium]MBR1244985.1 M23 family metallopeptidase [Bradyrhizobium sp. AUGA SZCCT0274]MBR1252947.1 M23 family metallopeptidase [Bradyrhizobium sp. AUGA SZCCT0240]